MNLTIGILVASLLVVDTEKVPVETPPPKPWLAKVIRVTDGDTITVLRGKKEQVKLRLVAIDAPERGQEFGSAARKYLSKTIHGKRVHVHESGRDKYGRVLARIVCNGHDVNQRMIAQGFAWHYRKYSDSKKLQEAEDLARREKRGLWKPGNAMAPWDFRRIAPAEKAARIAANVRAESTSSPTAPSRSAAAVPTSDVPSESAQLTHWITRSSRKRHNSSCRWFKRSRGSMCRSTDGIACKICGG